MSNWIKEEGRGEGGGSEEQGEGGGGGEKEKGEEEVVSSIWLVQEEEGSLPKAYWKMSFK